MVGNDRISSVRFPYLTIIEEKTDGTPWGGSGVLTENRVGADNLAWEKAKKFDIGMDLHLFGDRFTMTVDYFRDRREGIFQERAQIPDYVGVISMPLRERRQHDQLGRRRKLRIFPAPRQKLPLHAAR